MYQLCICILHLISKLVHLIPSCNLDTTLTGFSKLLPPHICSPPLLKFSTFITHPPIYTPVYLSTHLLEYISRQNSVHKIYIGYRTVFFTFYKELPRRLKSRTNLQNFCDSIKEVKIHWGLCTPLMKSLFS